MTNLTMTATNSIKPVQHHKSMTKIIPAKDPNRIFFESKQNLHAINTKSVLPFTTAVEFHSFVLLLPLKALCLLQQETSTMKIRIKIINIMLLMVI